LMRPGEPWAKPKLQEPAERTAKPTSKLTCFDGEWMATFVASCRRDRHAILRPLLRGYA